MILSLCTGNKWADKFNVFRCLNVAYCAGEGLGGLPSRFNAGAKHYNITLLHNFTFYSLPPQLFEDSAKATIKQFCEEWKVRQATDETDSLDLLIIDTLHTATVGADENSAQQMGKALYACRWIANELGCAVILVHHTNKTGSMERGISALRGAMDFMIKIEKASDIATEGIMLCEKLKDGEKWANQCFSLCLQDECESAYVSWNESVDSKETKGSKIDDKTRLKAEMMRYIGKRLTCKSLAEAVAKNENYIRKLLNELENAKECQRELSDPKKDQSNRNPWVYWIDATQEKEAVDD